MSFLKEELERLQKEQLKADFLKSLRKKIGSLEKKKEFEECRDEMLEKVYNFLDDQVEEIETGKVKHLPKDAFDEADISVLKALIARFKQKSPGTEPIKPPKAAKKDSEEELPREDKITFALNNQHLANKEVTVTTKDGEVKGTVVGLDAPHIVVRTETGYTVNVTKEQVTA